MNFREILQNKILFNILSFMETPSYSDKTLFYRVFLSPQN